MKLKITGWGLMAVLSRVWDILEVPYLTVTGFLGAIRDIAIYVGGLLLSLIGIFCQYLLIPLAWVGLFCLMCKTYNGHFLGAKILGIAGVLALFAGLYYLLKGPVDKWYEGWSQWGRFTRASCKKEKGRTRLPTKAEILGRKGMPVQHTAFEP